MYSNKDNINLLTALLVGHGVSRAVVCPGSRNAPIVHNLNECPDIMCCPVTDERSAGFYALGMAQASGAPVAVCVTSGTALLNLAPAVAEAFYQHIPLIVISADRPQAWIGQLDGQTLPQHGALGRFVGKCVTLPEPTDDESRWHCARLINEAMLAAMRNGGCPVQINVPVSEPLFGFTVSKLPDVRAVTHLGSRSISEEQAALIAGRLLDASRPMVIVGQHPDSSGLAVALSVIGRHAVVLHEPQCPGGGAVHFDEVLHAVGASTDYMPDFVLYAGDTVVSKRLKKFLRGTLCSAEGGGHGDVPVPEPEIWSVSADGEIHDTFMSQTTVIEADAHDVMSRIAECLNRNTSATRNGEACRFYDRWQTALASAARHAASFEPPYSQMMAVKRFEEMLDDLDYDFHVHYANSSAVRLANIYAGHYIYVNRGVNGIEGSLSTAAGFSVADGDMTFCVIGDLSFFYDNNALWSQCLRGNLRILLLNNCGGGIFHQLPGLDSSPVRDSYIAAGHHASAHGICDAHDIGYLAARNSEELEKHIGTFMYSGTRRPLVLEVFTDPEEDAAAVKEYYESVISVVTGK